MAKSKRVTIVEVSLRDGLQNESTVLPTHQRVTLAKMLEAAGATRMELGAFVRADKIPQMAGSFEVVTEAMKILSSKVRGSVLVPNERGMLDALKTPIKEVAVFTACSETFTQKNINCTIEESFQRMLPVVQLAKKNKIRVRGYLSTCFGCPYEGKVSETKVVKLAQQLFKMGCYEISIGDTIGVATPSQVDALFKKLKKVIPAAKLAGHFHDTRGTAIANILAAYNVGISVFDSSLGGLGGCPYAVGASGNVATEDLIYMFDGMKVKTGLNLEKLLEAHAFLKEAMGKDLRSRVGQAGPWVVK